MVARRACGVVPTEPRPSVSRAGRYFRRGVNPWAKTSRRPCGSSAPACQGRLGSGPGRGGVGALGNVAELCHRGRTDGGGLASHGPRRVELRDTTADGGSGRGCLPAHCNERRLVGTRDPGRLRLLAGKWRRLIGLDRPPHALAAGGLALWIVIFGSEATTAPPPRARQTRTLLRRSARVSSPNRGRGSSVTESGAEGR
jgi:hypothetical protein